MLRENFTSSELKFLKHDIPLMALTATATLPVREDIVKSLQMSEHTEIVLTSFFRPNLRFTVSQTCVLLFFFLLYVLFRGVQLHCTLICRPLHCNQLCVRFAVVLQLKTMKYKLVP